MPDAGDQLTLSAIILAGGRSQRMGGTDKASLEIMGRTMLARAVSSWPSGTACFAVGPKRPTPRPVTWCWESPPGGGPVAAVAAALPLVTTEMVALMAVDLPLLGPVVESLICSAAASVRSGDDGAWLADSTGHSQPLASCVATQALAAAMPTDPAGRPLHAVLSSLQLVTVGVDDDYLRDTDTFDDLLAVTRLLQQAPFQHTEGEGDDR